MPPIVLTVLGIVKLAIRYAPEATKVYRQARELIAMWFSGGLITIEQQALLKGWADAHEAATLAGIIPPELVVDPDPAQTANPKDQTPTV